MVKRACVLLSICLITAQSAFADEKAGAIARGKYYDSSLLAVFRVELITRN